MSSVYNLEPPTHGRVTLHTTHGPLDVRLWSSHTPHTCRNFVQHCLNGYYDGLPFHRIVPDLLVQTGDRSGTGHGGHVALPDKAGIPKEIVGRLKFRKRGLVGMVADDEGLAKSQFFITLTKADWLDGQHTIFAQVVGDTIYNVLNIAATGERNHVDDDAPRIKSVTIDLNPFPELTAAKKDQSPTESVKREPVKKPVRNKRLLSFANDSDSDSDDSAPTRMLKPAEPKRRIRRNSDSTLFLCQRDPPPASEPKPEAQSSASTDRKRKHPESDRSDAVRKANEEFERLKAELAGMDEKGKEKHQPQPPKEDDGKEDETEAMCRAMAEVTTEDERDDRRRRKRRRKDEGETLRRLKAFEGKVVKARRMGESADDGKMWYAKRLNLATMAGEDDEYEVRMPKTKQGSVKLRRG